VTRVILGTSGSKRRSWSVAVTVAAMMVLGVVFVAGSEATTSTVTQTCSPVPAGSTNTLDATSVFGGFSNFEIDAASSTTVKSKTVSTKGANLALDGVSPCVDWNTVPSSSLLVKPDAPSGSGDDSFTGGTSENSTTPTIASGSIPPNKSDLQDFGIFRESNASGKFLNLFWSRVNAPSGTVDMDFELNKIACDGTAALCSNNGVGFVTPLRSNGDRLITYDLANGGTVPTISIYTWSGTSSSGSWSNGTVISGAAGEALGSINYDPISDGGTNTNLGAKSALTFGEVSISYKALFGHSGSSGCGAFGSVYLKSRSSNTFTDELKDFVAPESVQITNCTTIKTSASNQPSGTAQTVGGTIGDTATLSNAQSPTNGVVFTAYGPFNPTTAITLDSCVAANLRYTSPAIALTGPTTGGDYTASVPLTGSNAFTPAAAGRYEWIASYAADANNGASTTLCGDSNEQSIVGPATPVLATSASNGVTAAALGVSVTDSATLTGTANQPNGSPAGGSITFKLYGPADVPTCIDPGTTGANLVFTSTPAVTVSGDTSGTAVYGPVSFAPATAGTYYWVASYSGNAPNTNP
jgi:hypothetical protein